MASRKRQFTPMALMGRCVKETDLALLVALIEMDDELRWIPKSQVHEDSEVCAVGDEGMLVVPEWLYRKIVRDLEEI